MLNIIDTLPDSNLTIPHCLGVVVVVWPSCCSKKHNPGNVALVSAGAVWVFFASNEVAQFCILHKIEPLFVNTNHVEHLRVLAGVWINLIQTPGNSFSLFSSVSASLTDEECFCRSPSILRWYSVILPTLSSLPTSQIDCLTDTGVAIRQALHLSSRKSHMAYPSDDG